MKTKRLLPKESCRQSMFGFRLKVIVSLVLLSCGLSQAQTTNENDIGITVKATAYSLKFVVDDPESYEIVNVTCRSAREHIADQNFTCEGLDPCTIYTATLTIKVLSDEHEEVKNVDAETSYVSPLVKIVEVTSDVEEIHLAWEAIDKSCISAYKIDVIASYKEFTSDLSKERTDWLIGGLKPCQEHNITLKTFDVKNMLISTLPATSTTKRVEPGNVTGITIDTTYERGHAKVTWNYPDYNTCIDYYYLKWFTKDCENAWNVAQHTSGETPEVEIPDDYTCSWSTKLTDYNAKEYTINGLQGCETYGFQIFLNNEEKPNSDVEHFTALEEVPGAVMALPSEPSASSVILHWDAPKTNARCVKYYEVIVLGPTEKEEIKSDTATEDTYARFDDLEPCGSYHYTIQPVSLNGTKAEIMSSGFVTLEDRPSAVRQLELYPESKALDISWSQPDYANLCIKEYRLTLWNNGKGPPEARDVTTSETKAKIENLRPCQSYTLQIIPTTHDAKDGELMQMETETKPEKPGRPTDIKVTSLFSDGIELTASYLTESNCETIFASFECYPRSVEEKLTKKSAEKTVGGIMGGFSFKALVAPLSPFTEYICAIKLYNVAGYSDPGIIAGTYTKQYYSEIPEGIALNSSTDKSLAFTWEQPKYPNGNINVYISHFQRVRAEYFVPSHCPQVKMEPISRESSSRQQSFAGLQSYTRYSIQIAAKNEYGLGEYTRPFMVVTEPAVSEPVTKLRFTPQGPFETDEEYRANVLVSWTIPCKSNGKILCFELLFRGTRGEERDNFYRSINMAEEFEINDGNVIYNETNLKPDFTYQVSVAVRTLGVDNASAEISGHFESPAGIPKRFNETTAKKARVTVFEADNPTKSAVVRFPAYILESESGEIIYAALLISQKGCNDEPSLQFGALATNKNWPPSRKWSEVYADKENLFCIPQYQTTKIRWEPKANAIDDMIQFTVGTENCNTADDHYCNGPLTPDTEFYLVIRLFTKSGYNDAIILDFRTESLIQLELILISISCCLLLALFAGFAYIYMKKRMQWKRQSCHDIEDPFGDILTKNFATYYNEISRPERISREFKELTMVAMDFSYSASELSCSKNRYTDIYPYDKNRVILDIDAEGSDYINASFIDGYRRKKQYIATQGPKPESTLDFWRMVLQHNIRVIVMLTQFIEGDIVKCHEYFPYKSKGINVTVKKKETFELYDRREMSVTHDRYGLKQKVVHLYFKKWPDHGVPVDPTHLITFVRKVKAEKIPSYSSVVVHCSAGVGRTGTFIGLDIIMERIKNESKVNIYGTVKKLRFQRMKMVQTMEQYSFLYKCAYELVKHKDQRNKMKQKEKNIGSAVDTEANMVSAISTLPGGPGSKNNGRIVPTQLSAIPEVDQEPNAEMSATNGTLNREKPYLRLNYGSSPPLVNGFINRADEQSNDNNESAM